MPSNTSGRSKTSFAAVLLAGAFTISARAQLPGCPECLSAPPVFDDEREVSYVLCSSAPIGDNCNGTDLPYRGWTRGETVARTRFGSLIHLVSIQDAAQNQFILESVMSNVPTGEAWIGLTECTPRWTDGSFVTYLNFCGPIGCGQVQCARNNTYYVLMNGNSGCWGYTLDWASCCYGHLIPGIIELPCTDAISQEPSSQIVGCGEPISLSVCLSGQSAAYSRLNKFSWRRNGQVVHEDSNSSSACSTLTIPSATAGDAGNYDVVIETRCRELVSVTVTVGVRSGEGDLNDDGVVDLTDLAALLSNFGRSGAELSRSDGDINGDMQINLADLAVLLSEFGTNCQ